MERIKKSIKFFIQKCLRFVVRVLSPLFRTREDEVIFVAVKRRGYADNLKYVCDDLVATKKLRLTWATEYPDTCGEIKEKGITIVKLPSFSYIFAQLRSKVVIYNDAIPPYMPKKRGQIYINTWHGGINFKHIGYDYLFDQSKLSLKKFALGNPQPDFFLSGSRFFTENTAESFRFSQDVFLPWGLPRNDVLFQRERHEEIAKKVRARYGIPDEKRIALFAPTFRVAFESDLHEMDPVSLREALSQRFGKEWVVMYRGHYFVKNDDLSTQDILDCTLYPDSQELLIAADVLLSDYSSMMWDMSMLRRPVFVYAPDVENYEKNERAFAYPMEKWPYPIAFSNEELYRNILDFSDDAYQKKLDAFFTEAGSYERPDTCKKVTELVLSYNNKEQK